MSNQAENKIKALKERVQQLTQVINEIYEHFDGDAGVWQDRVFMDNKFDEHGLSYPVGPSDFEDEEDETEDKSV